VPTSRSAPLVLVAEDNQVNQIVFQQLLEGLGLDQDLAVNGRQAVEKWLKLRPNLVVMDVSMPELNGLEATQEIRAIEAREGLSPTPIIAVTAHSLKGDEDRCLAAGMDDYMSKPISPEKFGAMLERWLPGADLHADTA
jgi:CheY-like chemotaxis protein